MRYVVFLRAINVGGRRIKMSDLRAMYRTVGYADAETYIASGNVIFTSDTAPDRLELERSFKKSFGFASDVFLRSEADIESILRRVPWTDTTGTVEVSLLHAPPDPQVVATLESIAETPEALVVDGSEVFYLRTRDVSGTSLKESTTMRILGENTTRRGLRTIRKIHDKFLADGEATS